MAGDTRHQSVNPDDDQCERKKDDQQRDPESRIREDDEGEYHREDPDEDRKSTVPRGKAHRREGHVPPAADTRTTLYLAGVAALALGFLDSGTP
jgi:hypothetical protein